MPATVTPSTNILVKYRPDDALKRQVPEDARLLASAKDARVVWIRPWNLKRQPLTCITDQISQGPLLSVAYSQNDGAACIIFQHAQHARAFLERNTESVRASGRCLYGPAIEVFEGQKYPYDNSLRAMEPPSNERRRLTFARQRLFADGLTEEKFKEEIFTMVGEHNVMRVWLFNSGNGEISQAVSREMWLMGSSDCHFHCDCDCASCSR